MRAIYGVGINDASYSVSRYEGGKRVWLCPYYLKWLGMLRRCYSHSYQATKPTYIGCTICPDWVFFSRFKAWMEAQKWEGRELDKDLLVKGNKVYGPDTCAFVDVVINKFLNEVGAHRGPYPIGVSLDPERGTYLAQCWDFTTGRRKNLGRFSSPEEAHAAWLAFKLRQARHLASKESDPRIARALIERYENYGKAA